MKKTQFILTFFLASILLLSCTTSPVDVRESDHEARLKMITSDPLFIQLQKVDEQQAYNIATHKYDIKGIIDFRQSQGVSICDIDKAALSQIKGGLVYQEIECNGNKIRNDFFIKYEDDLAQLSENDFMTMTEMYKESQESSQLTVEQIIEERAKNQIQQ